MSPFTVGRMRWIDLLALWHELNPDSHQHDALMIGAMPPGNLAALLLSP